jgi:hypothetical protein
VEIPEQSRHGAPEASLAMPRRPCRLRRLGRLERRTLLG